MKKQTLYLSLFLATLLAFSSCEDDHDHDHDHGDNEITINFIEPTDGSTIMDCADAHIHIEFSATNSLHEVKVKLHPESNTSENIIDFDQHSHQETYTFDQDVDLCSYAAGTVFHLEAEVYKDHDGNETVKQSIEFEI